MTLHDLQVIKKNGLIENFNIDKILTAISKAAEHTLYSLSAEELASILEYIYEYLEDFDEEFYQEISVDEIHDIVIAALFKVREDVAQRYVAYHEFKKAQEQPFKELFDNSTNVENLSIHELKRLQETIIAKNLAKTYNLRPDWLDAVNAKIIEIPLVETLWYKTYETKVFDFLEVLENQEKYFGQTFDVDSIEDLFMILTLLINQYGPLYTRDIMISNFVYPLFKFYDKSSEKDFLKLIEKQFLFVAQLVKSLNLDVTIGLALDFVHQLFDEKYRDYTLFLIRLEKQIETQHKDYYNLFDPNNHYNEVSLTDLGLVDNRALNIKLNVQVIFDEVNGQIDIFTNKLNKYLNMVMDIFKVHEKRAKIDDGEFIISFENIPNEIGIGQFKDLLSDLNIDFDLNNERNYIIFKFKK